VSQRQQRGGGPPASPGLDLRGSGTPAAMLPGGADRSPSPGPMSFAGRRSLSPYSSSPVVTTPEQLQRYLVRLVYHASHLYSSTCLANSWCGVLLTSSATVGLSKAHPVISDLRL